MKESQLKRCKEILKDVVVDLSGHYASEIMNTVNELYDEGEGGKATLKVPLTISVTRDKDVGYIFKGDIDIKKVVRTKDSRDPVIYKPEIPDLPGMSDPATHEDAETDAEVTNAEIVDDLEPGDNGDFFVFNDGKKVSIIDFESIENPEVFQENKTQLTEEKLDVEAFRKVTFEGNPKAHTAVRGMDGEVAKYYLFRDDSYTEENTDASSEIKALPAPPEENKESEEQEICGNPHADGIRKCQKEKGHTGRHSYGAAVKKPGTIENDENKPIGEILAEGGVTIEEAEEFLRSTGKLGFTIRLTDHHKLEEFVRDNVNSFVGQVQKYKAGKAA